MIDFDTLLTIDITWKQHAMLSLDHPLTRQAEMRKHEEQAVVVNSIAPDPESVPV